MILNNIVSGDIFDNEKLKEMFKCAPQGGMRRSRATNSLVLISNHVDSIYNDIWVDDVLYYTGMGTNGDQRLDFRQNKTLAESHNNGIRIYLFEVFKKKQYTYIGKVKLSGTPYQEFQMDQKGKIRKVWIFPLKRLDVECPLPIEVLEDLAQQRANKAKKLSFIELTRGAQSAARIPASRKSNVKIFQRNPYVVELTLRRASGACQLCQNSAPFLKKDNSPYLEVHHILWLSEGGEDTLENTVALCPNCHRKMHILADKKDIAYLQHQATQLYNE